MLSLEGKEAVPVLMDCFSGRMVALFPAASALQFSVAPLRGLARLLPNREDTNGKR